jgi:hypothetical protein
LVPSCLPIISDKLISAKLAPPRRRPELPHRPSLIPHLDRRVHEAVVDLRAALNPVHCPHACTLLSAHRKGIGIVKKMTNATEARDTTFLICSCSPQR